MSGFFASLLGDYREELERHRNRPFLKAVMAASAMAAIADGEISLRERVRLDKVMEALEQLKIFDPHEGVDLFNDYVREIEAWPEQGRNRALADVKAVALKDREQAQLIIRVCLAISRVDGEIPLTEQVEIVRLCSELNIDPGECGLYIDKGEPSV
jgi:tellurite resistance protein